MANYKVVDAEHLDSDLTSVADAIREQTGKTEAIAFPNGFVSAPAELVEVGRQKEWSDFWDVFQQNGKRANYTSAFAFGNWNSTTFRPKYDMYPTSVSAMLQESSWVDDFAEALRNAGVKMDCSNCTNFFMFCHDSGVRRVGVVGSAVATNVQNMFGWTGALHTIDKMIVSENITDYTNTFAGCGKLVNLTMEGTIDKTISFSASPLSLASAKSVISCLKNFTGTGKEYTTTVTFGATTWGYLDAEGNASPDGTTWREYITNTLCWNC